jgi:hypothetical protein
MMVSLLKHNRGSAIYCTAEWYAGWLRQIANALETQGAFDAADVRALEYMIEQNHVPATRVNA